MSNVDAQKMAEGAVWRPQITDPPVPEADTESLFLDNDFDSGANEKLFRDLADQWRRDTRYLSSVTRMAMHPAYQRIIGMGRPALPFILKELQQRGDHWLWALFAITGEDPASPDATFHEAVQAWLEWGRQKGYLT